MRKDSDLIAKIEEINDNLILFTVKNEKEKLTIANVYRHNSGEIRKYTSEDVIRIFNKYKDSNLILGGDWNTTPENQIKELVKSKCRCYTNKLPKKGTRIKSNRRRKKRVIYGISNKKEL